MIGQLTISETLQRDLACAVRILKEEGGCSAVYLFGSGTAGTFHDHSDIDLAVQGCPKERFFWLFGRLLCELERPVDLVDLDAPDPFVQMLHASGSLRRVG